MAHASQGRVRRLIALIATVGSVAIVAAAGPVTAAPRAGSLHLLHGKSQAVCPGPVSAGHALCTSRVFPDASSSPVGLTPAQMKNVYNFPTSTTAGASTTIAIVDAYDLPTAANDLNVFSQTMGLPTMPSCPSTSPCFAKVNQTGGTSYPRYNSGWGLEIALDIEWAHAIAPGANILLVEASSNSFTNLLKAEDYAASHAQYVSNSWGASEFSSESSYDSHFSRSGVSFFVSAGDAGLPAEYPSSSPNVISVGGTKLTFNADGTISETGWSKGGGGCSAYETATPAQGSFSEYSQVNCAGTRGTPDVSLDADPNSGAAVYDGSKYNGQTGWYQVGGTSLSSPMVAGRAADSGAVVNAAYVYGNNITFRDITSGNNGAPCLIGYDLCTGRGSWTGATP
jgi:subtilase family serine protease